MPLPHPAARVVGIAVVEVVALLARLTPRVEYCTEVGNGINSVLQIEETVTGSSVEVTVYVAVEAA